MTRWLIPTSLCGCAQWLKQHYLHFYTSHPHPTCWVFTLASPFHALCKHGFVIMTRVRVPSLFFLLSFLVNIKGNMCFFILLLSTALLFVWPVKPTKQWSNTQHEKLVFLNPFYESNLNKSLSQSFKTFNDEVLRREKAGLTAYHGGESGQTNYVEREIYSNTLILMLYKRNIVW